MREINARLFINKDTANKHGGVLSARCGGSHDVTYFNYAGDQGYVVSLYDKQGVFMGVLQ